MKAAAVELALNWKSSWLMWRWVADLFHICSAAFLAVLV